MKCIKHTLTCLSLLLVSSASTQALAQKNVVPIGNTIANRATVESGSMGKKSYPGGITELFIDKKNDQLPIIKFGTKEPIIIEQEKSWRVLIGLNLQTLPGDYLLYVKHNLKNSSAFNVKFNVAQKKYPLASATLETNEISTIHREHKSFSTIDFTNSEQPSLPLRLPVNDIWENTFGTIYRVKGGESFMVQNLIHYKSSQLTPVQAPQNAIVSKIETNDSGTKTMYLDHGRGLYSILSGLNDLTVDIGNGVVAGAVLGKMKPVASNANQTPSLPTTVTLTWQLVMNGNYINPLLLVVNNEPLTESK